MTRWRLLSWAYEASLGLSIEKEKKGHYSSGPYRKPFQNEVKHFD